MGLDVGDRTLGVALSDPFGWTARGVEVIRRTTLARDVQAAAARAAALGAGLVVVGLPRSLDGTLGPQAQKVLTFVEALREASPIPVELWDERLTTRIAERALRAGGAPRARRRVLVDQVAAAVILQGFLDARRARARGPGADDNGPAAGPPGGDPRSGAAGGSAAGPGRPPEDSAPVR